MDEIEIDTSDQEYFDLWLKGDEKGFSLLYNKYKNRVFGFLLKMTGPAMSPKTSCRKLSWPPIVMRRSLTVRGVS